MITLNPASRITMEINHNLTGILELFGGVDAGLDFEVAGVLDFEVVPRDHTIVDLESLVAQVGHFVGVAGWADDYVGDLLQVREDVHEMKGFMAGRKVRAYFLL
jgi:hypothetical protein